MTPSDLIADLRDIHTPPAVADAGAAFAYWPLFVFFGLVALAAGWSVHRRRRWRREAAFALKKAKSLQGVEDQWAALLILLKNVARHRPGDPAPSFIYAPPNRIGPDQVDALTAEIERRIA